MKWWRRVIGSQSQQSKLFLHLYRSFAQSIESNMNLEDLQEEQYIMNLSSHLQSHRLSFHFPTSLSIKHLLCTPPPPRPVFTSHGAFNWTLLHPIRHAPPLLNFRIRRHARHIFVKSTAYILERREESWARLHGEEDGICRASVRTRVFEGDRMRREFRSCTIANVRVFDLLENVGPDCCVALFVFFDAFGAEVEPLADAAGSLVCRWHDVTKQ
jgi:hypothetical protein